MIVEPIANGAVHVTTTLVPLTDVTGAVGVDGVCAARIDTVVELFENPKLLRAMTLKEYVEPIDN